MLALPLAWSRSVFAAAFVVHLLPLLAAYAASVTSWVPIIVTIGVLASSVLHFLQARRLAMVSILLRDSGEAELVANGVSTSVEVLDSSVNLGVMVVLRWRGLDSACAESAVLTRDGLTVDQWRRLRTWVRWRINRSSV